MARPHVLLLLMFCALVGTAEQNDNSNTTTAYDYASTSPPYEVTNGSTAVTTEEPMHRIVFISRRLFLVVIPIITVVGVVGNALMLVIMRRPSQRRSPVSIFMSALAVADTIVLVFDFINNWINFVSAVHLKSSSVEFCRFHNFLFSTTYTYCAWLVVCVSVERLIVVWSPLRAKTLCTTRKAVVTVCVLPIPCALLHSFNFLIWRIDESGRCDLDDTYQYFNQNVQAWLSAVFYSYLPVLLLIVSNSCIVWKLVRAQVSRKAMGADSLQIFRVTLTVVVVCVFYVILTVPLTLFYSIIFYLDQFTQRAPEMELARTLILILGLLNHAVNFFLYVLTSENFRKELHYICCCCRRHTSGGERTSGTFSNELNTSMTSTPAVSTVQL